MSNIIRQKRILASIDISKGSGLEIGPLTAPIISKEEANIYYLDHVSQEELKKKYKNEPVNLDEIVPIDFALNGKSLTDTVKGKKFDYVVASHVIEHLPDVVSWLEETASILKNGGILTLAIPDKRFTFDITRRTSSVNEVIGAYIEKLERPTSFMMYDFARECSVETDNTKAWNNEGYFKKAERRWPLSKVLDMCRKNIEGEYVDCHCFTFTPYSFIEIIRELTVQNLVPYELASMTETQENELEFYVSLRKVSKTKPIKARLKKIPNLANDEDKREQVLELKAEVARHRKEIEDLKKSTSWKVTYPLRYASDTIKKRKQAV